VTVQVGDAVGLGVGVAVGAAVGVRTAQADAATTSNRMEMAIDPGLVRAANKTMMFLVERTLIRVLDAFVVSTSVLENQNTRNSYRSLILFLS
jgi:hypothetical protein